MRPTKLQRQMALLIHFGDKTELFPIEESKRNQKSEALGVSRNTLVNWLGGGKPRDSALNRFSEAIHRIVGELNPNLELGEPRNFIKDTGVMKLGQLLGLTRTECREAIDQKISSVLATFSIFNVDVGSANSTWGELGGKDGGYYLMYRMETTKAAKKHTGYDKSIMVVPIAVRHLLSGNKSMSRGFRKIRAKAHVYSFTGSNPYFEYDGYITRQDGAGFHHWLFQSRNQVADDLFYLMTRDIERVRVKGSIRQRLFLLGTLHTRNQERLATSGTWPVVLEKVDLEELISKEKLQASANWQEFDDLDSYFMREWPDLVQPDAVDELLKEYMSRANRMFTISPFEFE